MLNYCVLTILMRLVVCRTLTSDWWKGNRNRRKWSQPMGPPVIYQSEIVMCHGPQTVGLSITYIMFPRYMFMVRLLLQLTFKMKFFLFCCGFILTMKWFGYSCLQFIVVIWYLHIPIARHKILCCGCLNYVVKVVE